MKVQDYLIINDENRLRKKVTDLTQKEQNNQYLIDEKLMKKEREIQSLREKDVINEEAIASLSDQIVKVMEEIKILKMKPWPQICRWYFLGLFTSPTNFLAHFLELHRVQFA